VAKEPIVNCCFCGIASTSSACEEMFEVITSSRVPNNVCNCCLDNIKYCPVVVESKEASDLLEKQEYDDFRKSVGLETENAVTGVTFEEKKFIGNIGGFENYEQYFTISTSDSSVRCRAYAGNSGVSCSIVSINQHPIDSLLSTVKVERLDGCSIWARVEGVKELLILDEDGLYFEMQNIEEGTSITVNGQDAVFNVCEYKG